MVFEAVGGGNESDEKSEAYSLYLGELPRTASIASRTGQLTIHEHTPAASELEPPVLSTNGNPIGYGCDQALCGAGSIATVSERDGVFILDVYYTRFSMILALVPKEPPSPGAQRSGPQSHSSPVRSRSRSISAVDLTPQNLYQLCRIKSCSW
jgi:hypothetical protein